MDIVMGVIGTLLLAGSIVFFIGMVVLHEYPKNPLRWAQERRRRVNGATVQRISALEHDLGYRPCSDEDCRSCKNWERELRIKGHPIWDHPALPAPPTMDLTALTTQAYDRAVEQSRPARFKRGTASGGPN